MLTAVPTEHKTVTTTYSPAVAVVAPPLLPAASVTRQTTTRTDYGSPGVVTSETVQSGPVSTTTYKQKTYETEDY
ncbi:MAG TPA: hypothetical protein VGH29_08380 [Candidatus Binataceae bacterium]